ncbi:unnamed protein product, partial [Discosporangium mesarthrocarpum]
HSVPTSLACCRPLETFESDEEPDAVVKVPVMSKGKEALKEINAQRGLGFDEWDLDFYLDLFKNKLGRDPTDVELFDMGQANSEHSRHWFFGGKMVIDGEEKDKTLFRLVKDTLTKDKPHNSIIAFHDNSSAIRGPKCSRAIPLTPGKASPLVTRDRTLHPILTAETHNFPSGVAPFPGAE